MDSVKVDVEVVLPSDDRGEHCHCGEKDKHPEPQERHPVACELSPTGLPGTAFLYFKL